MSRSCALLLTLATGFFALVYQVVWERYLAILLGSHAEATASILAIFLGGLAGGYVLFGRVSRRIAEREDAGRRLLLTYGLAEVAIGVFGLLFPLSFGAVRRLSVAVPHLGETGNLLADLALVVGLIGVPTLLMGATVPLLTQSLTRTPDEATRTHSLIYALNTIGAFAGAICAGYLLVPRYGLVHTIVAIGGLNLLAGLSYVLLSSNAPTCAPQRPVESANGTRGYRLFVMVAFLGGFAAMTLETVVIRLAGLSLGSSPFTFAAVVATFVLCIGIGSLAVSALGSRQPRWLLPALLWSAVPVLVVMYRAAESGPYAAHLLRVAFQTNGPAFLAYQAGAFLLLAVYVGPIALISGASLPLLFGLAHRDPSKLGSVAGRLFAWNTVGCLAGALLGGYALLFVLDLHHVFRLAMAAVMAQAVLITFRVIEGRARMVPTAAALGLLLLVGSFRPWSPEALSPGHFRFWEREASSRWSHEAFLDHAWSDREVVFYDDDPTTTVLVRHDASEQSLSFLTNGKNDGNTSGDYSTMSLLGLLPAILVDEPKRAFVVGWGTGISSSYLAGVETIDQVEVAEISSGVVRASSHFDPYNENASRNPRITIRRSDAYRALMRTRGSFDIIVSEPSNPWVAGVEMLYSQEFLSAARDRLTPNGVFVQWLQSYETTDEVIELIARTYSSVFADVAVWITDSGDYALIGVRSAEAVPEISTITTRWTLLEERFDKAGVETLAALLAHEVIPFGVLRTIPDDGPIHTLLHPRLNYLAVRGHFRGRFAFLPFTGWGEAAKIGRERSLLGRYIRTSLEGRLPRDAWQEVATTLCKFQRPECGGVLALWVANENGVDEVEDEMKQVWSRNGALNSSDLVIASLLFDPKPGRIAEVDVSGGERVLELYYALYSHATPFSPESLLTVVGNCVPETGRSVADCERLRANARRLVDEGRLDAEPSAMRANLVHAGPS